ncbi:small multi-drug export protein [Oceanobacillus halophilus]|uniref:DNA-binding protein n=1 Tax=Oceanobacillus halophilus TaxID=930130 RepID=A0A494ZR22_9BACI|nr:small multi-drug export protein [Oceanobacillus halophilus]RKQ28128.1 DNA-binding protein [Oceanobacillus halophilus]
MDLLFAYIVVFVLAAVPFFEAYAVIPLAVLTGLPAAPVIILGLLGNVLTVLVVIVFINKIKAWRRKRKANKEEKPESKRTVRAQRLWKKYGLPGLAMIGPMFVGSHLTAFMSITLGGTKKKTLYWMTGSIVIWSVTFTILLYFGIDFLGLEERGMVNYFNKEAISD